MIVVRLGERINGGTATGIGRGFTSPAWCNQDVTTVRRHLQRPSCVYGLSNTRINTSNIPRTRHYPDMNDVTGRLDAPRRPYPSAIPQIPIASYLYGITLHTLMLLMASNFPVLLCLITILLLSGHRPIQLKQGLAFLLLLF